MYSKEDILTRALGRHTMITAIGNILVRPDAYIYLKATYVIIVVAAFLVIEGLYIIECVRKYRRYNKWPNHTSLYFNSIYCMLMIALSIALYYKAISL